MPKTNTTTSDLDAARQALFDAEAAAQKAQKAARKAEEAADARRQAALQKYDQQIIDGYDEGEEDARIAEAHAALIAAVEADPVYAALAELATATTVAYVRSTEATRAATAVGSDRRITSRAPASDAALEPLLRHVTNLGTRRAAEAAEQASAARTAVGDAAAAGT
ncbi:hypothetical protein [Iamia sp.]|uniref:hypothetical protein n=1 Tax=Iamia sp. TaxID=2722710 RepID=UPI002CD4DDE6|nr:hypothetical protein [Iamia sp.]HXH58912.1 hypothetical protein [Iamia sp.]